MLSIALKGLSGPSGLPHKSSRLPKFRCLRIDQLEERRVLNAGDLDPTFGEHGLVRDNTPFNFVSVDARAAALQADGKIVTAGTQRSLDTGAPPSMFFHLNRYNPDGSLDGTFDGDGIAITGFAGRLAEAFAMAIQSDGKIVVAGNVGNDLATGNADDDIGLARFNPEGSIDETFGDAGRVLTDVDSGSVDALYGLAIDADGKIVVVGASDGNFLVARYDADGDLDTTFGGDGAVVSDLLEEASGLRGSSVARDVVIQPDGRIIVVGQSTQILLHGGDVAVPNSNVVVARYETNGDLDLDFSEDGIATVDFPNGDREIANAVGLQSDGQIVVGGSTDSQIALVRFDANGELDRDFSEHGVALILTVESAGNDLVIQPDDKIVVVGSATVGYNTNFAVTRFTADGLLDSTFVHKGIAAATDFPPGLYDVAYAVLLQDDGRVVAVGQSSQRVALARYLADGEEVVSRQTIGLRNESNSFLLRTENAPGPADLVFPYQLQGRVAISGDWNGDGVDTVGLYSPESGFFYLATENSVSSTTDAFFQYGPVGQGYIPLAGDWNDDGADTVGLYDPARGFFFLRNSNTAGHADEVFQYGAGGAGYLPITGNWDAQAGETVGLYQPASGFFFLRNSNSAGSADVLFQFGAGEAGTLPIAGDWDGAGGDSVGIYRPADAFVFMKNDNAAGAADLFFGYGPPGNNFQPITGDWDGPELEATLGPTSPSTAEHRQSSNADVLETLFAADEDWVG